MEDLHLQAREYLGDADPMQPLASPLYADLRGLPPLSAQVREDELLDDARRLVERADAAGVDATLEVAAGPLAHLRHAGHVSRVPPGDAAAGVLPGPTPSGARGSYPS